jgi:diguanylate cyclase (GGDEF)-like protein/PAS domain S-box-containing protein
MASGGGKGGTLDVPRDKDSGGRAPLRSFGKIPGHVLVAWSIFLAGAALSAIGWRIVDQQVERDARTRFDALLAATASDIQARLRSYHHILFGVQGLFHAAPYVDRATFYRYVANLGLAERAGALRSISFAERVQREALEEFETRVRYDRSMTPAGYPEFAIRPKGSRPEAVVLIYIEPFAYNDAAFGLDLLGDGVRRDSVERTRDSGQPVSTAAFKLLSAPNPGDLGVSLRLAVYRGGAATNTVEQRREAFSGVVSATFLVRDVVYHELPEHLAASLRIRVLDTGPSGSAEHGLDGQLLHESRPLDGAEMELTDSVSLEVGNRRWLMQVSAPRSLFLTTELYLPALTLAAGLLISLLLAGLARALLSSRQQALRLADRMTEDLRRSQAELAREQHRTQELIEALPNPVFFKGTDGRYQGVNKAWEAFFGIGRGVFIGKTVHDLYPNNPEIAQRLHNMDQVLWKKPGTQVYEASITTPGGTRHDTIYYKATYSQPDGSVGGLVGTIIDITARKEAERRLAMEHAVTRVLAEASTVKEAIPGVIRTICDAMQWACGLRWEWDPAERMLRCREYWGEDDAQIQRFLADCAARTIEPEPVGRGLVRRAYAGGSSVWIADFSRDTGLIRTPLVRAAGLGGGMSFALLLGAEVLGVLEFFFRGVREPDDGMVAISQSIGSQIGQFMARKQVEEAVRFVATHDGLTNLPNRVMFHQRLEHAITQAQRHGRGLAVLFVDLDRFKLINDTLGHEAGDTLLREVARRLQDNVRAGDTVARFGGDEFVVLLEEVSEPMYVGSVARKLILSLAESFELSGQEYHVSASIGVSTYPDDADNAAGLLKNADIAMYRAKERGRNTFQFYSSHMNIHSIERLTLESSLRRALERQELVLHYQPQVDIPSGRVTGVEALVRWQHPELGIVPPGKFISVAEETGLIVPIGEWVMHAACTALRAWTARGLSGLRVAVNLSPRQFLHGDLVNNIGRVLAETGCEATCLELEITESMVMHDPKRAVRLIRRLKQMGVQVAIDDFGTGYSSLAYLKRFPIDSLKIDRSFVQDIPGDTGNVAITQAVIAMAHSLGLLVIAEGVETREQFEFLRAQACDEYQGYYFSAPLPEAAALALIEERRVVARLA